MRMKKISSCLIAGLVLTGAAFAQSAASNPSENTARQVSGVFDGANIDVNLKSGITPRPKTDGGVRKIVGASLRNGYKSIAELEPTGRRIAPQKIRFGNDDDDQDARRKRAILKAKGVGMIVGGAALVTAMFVSIFAAPGLAAILSYFGAAAAFGGAIYAASSAYRARKSGERKPFKATEEAAFAGIFAACGFLALMSPVFGLRLAGMFGMLAVLKGADALDKARRP